MRNALPTILGYDVVCTQTARIIAPMVDARDIAEGIAAEHGGVVVVPVLSTTTRRIGYALPAVAAP